MNTTATVRLLDALRASQGQCSDYRVAKLLRVGEPTVSRWRNGRAHMSPENIEKACELAGLDPWEWNLRIAAEREHGPAAEFCRQALRDLDSVRATGQMSASGIVAELTRRASRAAILAGVVIAACFAHPEIARAGAPSPAGSDAGSMYILLNRIRTAWRRLNRQLARVASWLPPFPGELQLRTQA